LGVGAGENGEHPRSCFGRRRIDALDARVGVRRHHHHAVALLRHLDIVDITAAAGDEAGVLEPGNRLADTEFYHAFLCQKISPPNRAICGDAEPRSVVLEHDPEKAWRGLDPRWLSVFRKDRAPPR